MEKHPLHYFVEEYVRKYANMYPIYYSNKNNDSLDVLLAKLMENIINEFPESSRTEKVRKCFGENVSSIDVNY